MKHPIDCSGRALSLMLALFGLAGLLLPGTSQVSALSIDCTPALTTTSASFFARGGPGAVDVVQPDACSLDAVSNDSWITVTNIGSSNAGPDHKVVDYVVASNISLEPRTGTITIGGQTFTVKQSALPGIGLSFSLCDFDEDSKTEIGFHRAGLWGFLQSTQNYSFDNPLFFFWGDTGLQPIVDDFDGDGIADLAYIVPPSGGQSAAYAILQSSSNYSYGSPLFVPAGFPSLLDTPVVGDFDGDGKADPGVWRASQGVWIIPLSASNYASFRFSQWGEVGDFPVVADFDGDGLADLGFYRDGLWGILRSSQNYSFATPLFLSWGGSGLQPIVGDFDGDGKADVAYIVPSVGGQSAAYAILKSSANYSTSQPIFVPAGFPDQGDVPVVGDFDGDGKADPGIWREPEAAWVIPLSSTMYVDHIVTQWGQPGDIPFPNTTGRH